MAKHIHVIDTNNGDSIYMSDPSVTKMTIFKSVALIALFLVVLPIDVVMLLIDGLMV